MGRLGSSWSEVLFVIESERRIRLERLEGSFEKMMEQVGVRLGPQVHHDRCRGNRFGVRLSKVGLSVSTNETDD